MAAYLNIWNGPRLVTTIAIHRYVASTHQLVYDVQYDQLPAIDNPQPPKPPKSETDLLLTAAVNTAENAISTIRALLNQTNPTMRKYIIDRLAALFAETEEKKDPTAVG